MKRFVAALAVLLTATAAQAHNDGIHMHPHGTENWLPVAVALGIIALAAVAWKARQ